MDEPGVTPPLEQAEPRSDPGPQNAPVVPGTERPASLLQEGDPQDFVGPPEAPPSGMAPGDTAGLSHIRLALSDLEWPMTRDELLARAGDWRIPTTGTHFHALRQYLEGVHGERFRGPDEVVRAIGKARRELR